jgi:hypothetical protein
MRVVGEAGDHEDPVSQTEACSARPAEPGRPGSSPSWWCGEDTEGLAEGIVERRFEGSVRLLVGVTHCSDTNTKGRYPGSSRKLSYVFSMYLVHAIVWPGGLQYSIFLIPGDYAAIVLLKPPDLQTPSMSEEDVHYSRNPSWAQPYQRPP